MHVSPYMNEPCLNLPLDCALHQPWHVFWQPTRSGGPTPAVFQMLLEKSLTREELYP